MGADAYFYVVPYQDDFDAALEALRQREFEAGRYRPAVDWVQDYLAGPDVKPGPGAQHESIEAIFEDAAAEGNADGTASILDLWTISDEPTLLAASLLDDAELERYFGTNRPAAAQIADNEPFWMSIDRGTGRCVVAYDGDTPASLCFAGWSLD
jgi:hypothetical protein